MSPATLIDKGNETNRPSLVYLYSPECTMCELLDYKILKNQQVISYLNQHFLFYKIDITKEMFFNRLLYFYGAPVLLVIENGKIQTIISQIGDVNKFLFALKNYRMMPLELSLASYTNLKGEVKQIVEAVNGMLSAIYHLEKGDQSKEVIMQTLEQSVNHHPCFYNKYLLLKQYNSDQFEQKKQLRDSIIQNATGLSMMLFASEIQSMLNESFNLNENVKAEIQFEYAKHDFGEVKHDDIVVHKFPFTNISSVPLMIYAVTATCGCTVPQWTKKPIMPGITDSLTVFFKASALGNNVKSINVITNANKRNTMLTISAFVN